MKVDYLTQKQKEENIQVILNYYQIIYLTPIATPTDKEIVIYVSDFELKYLDGVSKKYVYTLTTPLTIKKAVMSDNYMFVGNTICDSTQILNTKDLFDYLLKRYDID